MIKYIFILSIFVITSNNVFADVNSTQGNLTTTINTTEGTTEFLEDFEEEFYSTEKTLQVFDSTEKALDVFNSTEDTLKEFDSTEKSLEGFTPTGNTLEEFNSTGNILEEFNSTEDTLEEFNPTGDALEEFNSTENTLEEFNSTENTFEEFNSTKNTFEEFNSTENTLEEFNSTENTFVFNNDVLNSDFNSSDVELATTTFIPRVKKCVSRSICYKDEDCGVIKKRYKTNLRPRCLGIFLGTCDCTSCISGLHCMNQTSCGGLYNSCDNKLGICKCIEAYKFNGFANYGQALLKFCNKQKCDGDNPDTCFGLPCRRGRCFCH